MGAHEHLCRIRDAALEAVDPSQAVKQTLRLEDNVLSLGERSWSLDDRERVLLVGGGKASVPMAEAAISVLGSALTAGVIVTKYEHAAGHTLDESVQVIEAGHPVPDEQGVRGAEIVMRLLADVTARDLVIVLLSGGGSALLSLPVEGISLQDLRTLTDLLLKSGATIDELNAVRKHLSRLKGGQLARAINPSESVVLMLSDVVGDKLDVIASGPTAPDPTTFEDAWAVLERYDILESVPSAVREHLSRGCAGAIPDTPKPDDPIFRRVHHHLVGSNRVAARAAVSAAEALGYRALLLTTFIEGEAREVARVAVALAKGIRFYGDPLTPPACLVWGGETTVTIRGEGKGGRNQELALAAALAMEDLPDVSIMALATDGTDGPTDAAGAIVDGETLARARAQGFQPRQALDENNSYPLLEAVGALLRTGPTGTNVNDLLVILVTKGDDGG